MIVVTREMIVNEEKQPEKPDDVLLPNAAAAYLGKLYGRPFTTSDFKNLRANYSEKITELQIEPVDRSVSITQWRRRDLDRIAQAIPSPRYSEARRQPRVRRKQT